MRCNNPNFVKIIDDPNKPGKKKAVFRPGYRRLTDGIENMPFNPYDDVSWIQVPCGHCLACRLAYSAEWADRCEIESKYHDHTWFITLTYREDSLVYGTKGLPTVEKDAISKFIRALRDKLGHDKNIRYFGCAEYGEGKGERKGFNPHYHIIVFGADLADLTIDMPDMSKPILPSGKYPIFRRKNRNGDFVMFSQTIYDCWEKGKIEVEEASWNTSAYVSRYVTKKHLGHDKYVYNDLGIFPEYIRMSTRPGIGAEYLLDNKDKLLKTDFMSVKNASGVNTYHPPRYFEKLMKKDEESVDAALMDANKTSRIINARRKCQESTSKKCLKQKMIDDEELLEKRTKIFTRSLT